MAAAYSPLVEARLRTLLASLPAVDATWTDLGFRQWGDPRFGGELIDHLTELFVSRDIPNTALDHFRASLAEAWGAVGGGRSRTEPRGQDGVLIVRAGQVDFVARDEAASSQVFVTATDDRSATARLVRELGWAELMYEASPDAGAGVAEQLASIWPGEVNLTAAWELEVLVDGKRLGQSERRARLTDEVPWLPMLVVASLRFPRASGLRIGRHVADVLDTMERIQLVRARRVQVLSAGGRADLPDRLRGVLPLPGDPPILVAESHDSEITWHGLDMLLQGVLELVGQERFKAEVSLTLRQLAPDGDMDIERPSTPELAAALGVADEQLHQVESAVSGAVEGVIERLKMVAPVLWGPGALTQLTEFASAPRTHDELVTLVAGFCNDSTVGARIVKHATAAATANELRRRLEISLPDFNDAVRTYFPTMPPVDNTDVLADQFRYRLGQRRSELIEWIRKCRYPEFSAGHAQVDWRQITSLTFIEPDPNWGTTLDELSRTQIDRQINEVMRNRFGSPDASGAELPALTDIRNANGAPLRTRIEGARHSVTAWCARNRTRRPSAWEGADFAADIRERLDGVGALDFEELSDEQLTSWLVKIDVWPPGMPETLVRDLLGLSDQELQAESEAENERRVQAARAASQVRFQGEAVDVDESLGGLVSRVAAFLETDPASLRARYKSTKLANLSGTPTTGARPSKSPARFGTASSRLTSAQTGAIGMVGEFVAFHWLKRHDRSGVVDETCWKSTNVRRVFEGAKGDDGLGFDFEVPHRDGSIMYEVKATSGEAGMIELGETEVRCAQQYSRSDRWRLLIVEEALSDEPRVHVLPNPFHRSSRDLYKFSGNSVRLHFALRTRD